MFVLWHRHTTWKGTDYKYPSGAWSRADNFVSTSDGYEYTFPCNFFFWRKFIFKVLQYKEEE